MNRWLRATLGVTAMAALCGTALADEAKEPAGKTLFLSNNCNTCHTIEAQGIQRKSAEAAAKTTTAASHKVPDLSNIGTDTKPEFLTQFLKKEVTAKDGKKHMKLWKGTGADLATLVGWLGEQKAEKKADAGAKAATPAADKAATDEKAAPVEKPATDAPAETKTAPEGESK